MLTLTIKEENQRFVVVIEKEIIESFKVLAKKENRSASNLAATLIKNYVEEHTKYCSSSKSCNNCAGVLL